jgi:Xaa-Pro dipeptidase
LGIERSTLFLPPAIHDSIVAVPGPKWVDASRLIDDLRLIKSRREVELTRAAARVSRAMMRAAIEAARPGVNEREVAAEVHRAMILEGGEPPGFGPFIRPTPRLGQEHGTWRDRKLVDGEALFLELAGCVGRYHAPMGRLVWLGRLADHDLAMHEVCREALQRVVAAIRPGVTAAEVYRAWQSRVAEAGLSHYRRHHCGYLVGIGFPPSWTGGGEVVGLRHDSDLALRPGMVFHLLSWLMGTGRGDAFASDTALSTEDGCELLTRDPNS